MLVYILIGVGAILLTLIAVVLIRTFNFKPKAELPLLEGEEEFDGDRAISNLQALVRCKTISYKDSSKEDKAEFAKLIKMLPELYPNVFKECEYLELPDRGLLFKWKGKNSSKPAVMMAHFDVVPVNEEAWDKPPFEGIIEDGILWGRGTIDTKVTFNGVLTAADHLISKGFVPENDMYFAFSGQEEINGMGAVNIVNYFIEHKIEPYLVVDEGGAVVEGIFPGVKGKTAMVGIAEKGMMNVKYTCLSKGGHASAPLPGSPLPRLANAIKKVEEHPFKANLTAPVAKMFDTLGRRSNFVYRMIFANLWLFKGVLDAICRKSGGQMNALMRTTVAFTKIQGSSAENVIPPEASLVTNIRLNPADTVDSALAYLKKTIGDDSIQIEAYDADNPSPISETDCDQYDKVSRAIASTWKGSVVSPYLMVQCSDSRRYGKISNHVYRFSAQEMTSEELGSIHGNNEKIRLTQIKKAVEFYIRLMKQC